MKVLFIGGNGNISWWCVEEAIRSGFEVYVIHRGVTLRTRREVQHDAKVIECDVRILESLRNNLKDCFFDVVCDFISYNDIHAKKMVDFFENRCSQYIVISSECVYRRTGGNISLNELSEKYEITEVGGYIQGKLLLENVFLSAFRTNRFPVTIVRPCSVYDNLIFTPIGRNDFTVAKMLLEGYPLIMLGNGENYHIPLHSYDFAKAFIHLVGNKNALGQDYLITADKKITWNDMARCLFKALKIPDTRILYLKKDFFNPEVIKDKDLMLETLESYNYSNSKIKAIAPGWKQTITYEEGIIKCIDWLMEDANRIRIDNNFYENLVRIIEANR